jgi:hypothetical protein
MQKIKMVIKYLSGNGWKNTSPVEFIVNEKIGIDAGRDEFATARGTAINLMKKNIHILMDGTECNLVVDNATAINIRLGNDGKWIKNQTTLTGGR